MAAQASIGTASLTHQNPQIATEEPPEWLLWAKRQQKEMEKIYERIRDLEKSRVNSVSTIRSLEEVLRQQSTNYTALEQRHSQLLGTLTHMGQKTDAMEQGVNALDSTYNVVTERLHALEGATRTTNNPNEEKLRQVLANIKKHEGPSEFVMQWRQNADTAHEKLQVEVNDLKWKIGEMAARNSDRQDAPKYRRPSPSSSEATTVDHQSDTGEGTGQSNEHAIQEELAMLSQQNLGLEEYFSYGRDLINRAMETYEKKIVKAFIQGLKEKHRRTTLEKTVEKKGWTWTSASEEITAMVEASKRIKKNNTFRRLNALEGLPSL